MFQITLKTARESCGYTVEEVAEYCGTSVGTLNEFENDSSLIPRELMHGLAMFYGIDLDIIYFGTEANCIKYNRDCSQFAHEN